jgi:hypothetical protein
VTESASHRDRSRTVIRRRVKRPRFQSGC